MRKMLAVVSAAAVLALMAWVAGPRSGSSVFAAEKSPTAAKPVVDSMHQFMEYVFEPVFHRLKEQMAKPPQDKAAWGEVKSCSLILAEAGNLLLMRLPKENAQAWKSLSCEQRESGGQLYLAARKRDFEAARKHYAVMVTKCNACHTKFAEGEHQLEP